MKIDFDGFIIAKKQYRLAEGRRGSVVLQFRLFLTGCYKRTRYGARDDFKDHWTLWHNADWKKIPNLKIVEQPK